jgi:hypothetical protein
MIVDITDPADVSRERDWSYLSSVDIRPRNANATAAELARGGRVPKEMISGRTWYDRTRRTAAQRRIGQDMVGINDLQGRRTRQRMDTTARIRAPGRLTVGSRR